MEGILNFLISNPLVTMLLASPIGLIVVWAVYQAIIKMLLTEKNVVKIAEDLDKYVDKLQSQNTQAGKLTRERLIAMAEHIIVALKKDDGVN